MASATLAVRPCPRPPARLPASMADCQLGFFKTGLTTDKFYSYVDVIQDEVEAYFDEHLNEDVLFFSVSLRARTVYLLAESARERERWGECC